MLGREKIVSNLRDNIEDVKKISQGIIHVSRAMKELQNGALTEEAILILVAHRTKMSQKAIKKVLAGLSQLEELYVKPKKGKESENN